MGKIGEQNRYPQNKTADRAESESIRARGVPRDKNVVQFQRVRTALCTKMKRGEMGNQKKERFSSQGRLE